eukprot:79849-Pelagomonas_calceolata.AAC.5
MGSMGLWLAIISQLEYPIQILAAAPAAAAAPVPDADAWKLCCWELEELCSGVELCKQPKLSTNCHTVLNTHGSCGQPSCHLEDAPEGSSALLAADSWMHGPWLGLL